MGLMNYLLRDRHGTYYFRRVIPAELRPFMPAPWTGKTNWKESLQIKDPVTAKRAHARLLPRCVADFEEAERVKREGPSKPSLRHLAALPPVAEIEADFLSGLLEEDAAHRISGDSRRQHLTAAELAEWDRLVPLSLAGRAASQWPGGQLPERLPSGLAFAAEEMAGRGYGGKLQSARTWVRLELCDPPA